MVCGVAVRQARRAARCGDIGQASQHSGRPPPPTGPGHLGLEQERFAERSGATVNKRDAIQAQMLSV